VVKKTAVADEEAGTQVMSDEIRLHIETIARHLRGLGLTEQQIDLHVAPLKTRHHPRPNPPRRKGRPNIIESRFIPHSRKSASLA